MAGIKIDAVRKIYPNGFEAAKGIDIDVDDGEMLVLVGPSGCGKSTLLRMIAGLETISGGEITIGARMINDVDPADRNIAMVFQNYALYPHMTVYKNLAYGLKNRNVAKDEIETRVKETARILELDKLLDRRPGQLSGGQRQRVAMGRAIVRKPDVFLFDEPLSNLDAKLRTQMRVEIRKLQRSLKTTSVYVTHDQMEAMTLADKLVVMNGGEVEQIGTAMEVYHQPASVFVASFIGSPAMNLLPLKAFDQAYGLDLDHLVVQGTVSNLPSITLGVRPEDLDIMQGMQDDNDDENGLCLEIEVTAIEAMGAEAYIHGVIGKTETAIIYRTSQALDLAPGAKLRLFAPADRLHWFDPEDGKRL